MQNPNNNQHASRKVKALPINVYKNANYPGLDFSNRGISSKYDRLYLVTPEGYEDVDIDDERLVVIRCHFSPKDGGTFDYWIEPYAVKVAEGNVGWFEGGNYAAVTDGRFPFGCALPIRDRQDNYENYLMMMD